MACASLRLSPCPPTRTAGQAQKPAWRWQQEVRESQDNRATARSSPGHYSGVQEIYFFPVENCPLTVAVTSKPHHVSVTTTVSRFPLRVFLLVIKRRLPGSLFITWPESLKGNPFSNVSYGAVRWAIYHCPLWGGRGWASSLLKGCLRNALLFSWPNSPRLSWNTIMLYHD